MQQYLDLVKDILDNGYVKGDRTGTGTKSVFGRQLRFNLNDGFPCVTTKFTAFNLVKVELLWMLSGSTNIDFLLQHNCHIWDEWSVNGNIGPLYGKQWVKWDIPQSPTIDYQPDPPVAKHETITVNQIQEVINSIKVNPQSRRHIVSAWNVADLPDESLSPHENVKAGKMSLAPCHAFFQFNVQGDELSCQIYQRSCDVGLGLPFNIASYALLTHLIAHVCNLNVGELIWTGGDVHLYNNHIDKLIEILDRKPLPLSSLRLNNNVKDINDFTINDISLDGYNSHPSIKLPISV